MNKQAFISSLLHALKWFTLLLSLHFGIGWATIGPYKIEYLIDFQHIGVQLFPIGNSVVLTYTFGFLTVVFAFIDRWYEAKSYKGKSQNKA